MLNKSNPIGVMDSGIGGLTVVRELQPPALPPPPCVLIPANFLIHRFFRSIPTKKLIKFCKNTC